MKEFFYLFLFYNCNRKKETVNGPRKLKPTRMEHNHAWHSSWVLVFLLGTFTSVFRDNKSLRSYKTVEIKIFLNYFACGWKDPDLDPPK